MSDEYYETETGLADDFEFAITDAAFLKSAEVKNGEQLFLSLTGDTDEYGEYEVRILCGPGWDSLDGGKTAKHESGKPKRWNANTHMGLWIDRCMKPESEGGLDLRNVLASRGPGNEAKVWVGLKFHMKQRQFGFKNNQTGEDVSYSRLLPEAFLGEVGAANTAKPAASNSVADKVAAAKAKAAAAKNGSNGSSLEDQLIKLAGEHNNHGDFVDAAMTIDGVADDDDLLTKVVDPDGIYATARA